jgi:ATP-dependent exoDNAse (exonuclease V) alpha subunit
VHKRPAEIQNDLQSSPSKQDSQDPSTYGRIAAGELPPRAIAAGEWLTTSGEWVNDRTHGQQFKSRFMRTSAPTTTEDIEEYLGSGMIRGIGPVYAKKMVKAFGNGSVLIWAIMLYLTN